MHDTLGTSSPCAVKAIAFATSRAAHPNRIGCFVAGRVFVLHWSAKPDAFLLEAIDCAEDRGVYCFQRSDPSLILKPA